MKYSSRYATCAGREIHYTEWGSQHKQHGHRLAWPGAHRARHGRTGRAPVQPLPRDLPGHHRARLQPMEPRSGQRVHAGLLRASWPPTLFDQLGIARGALGRHLDGRRDRHGLRAAGLSQPQLKARIKSLVLNDNAPRLADAAVARIRAYAGNPPAFDTMAELEAFFRAGLQALWLAQRCAMAAPDRNLDAPPARWPRDAALRPGDGAAVHRPPERLRLVGRTTTRSRSRCCACAAPSRTWCCAMTTDEMMRRGPGLQGLARVVEIPGLRPCAGAERAGAAGPGRLVHRAARASGAPAPTR